MIINIGEDNSKNITLILEDDNEGNVTMSVSSVKDGNEVTY